MATPYKIVLGPKDIGNFHQGGYNEAAFAKASEVLQQDMESWHIIFSGLRHDHIVHAVLTILGLEATPEEIQTLYDRESSYQKPRYPVDEDVVKAMADKDKFKDYLDQQPHYSNFLLFFQREIEVKGAREALEEHLFADTDHARRLFPRIFCSIFHSYIHLGYAFEYNQPAILAQGLAMACVHDPDSEKIVPVFLESEKRAGGPRQKGKKTLLQIMQEIRENKTLKGCIDGDNPIDRTKNVADNATEEMVKYAAQYSISEDQLQDRMDEMYDTCSLLIATKPSPIPNDQPYKIDFFLLHSVNTLVMMPSFINHPWISQENGIRMIEWAGRCHLLTYVSQTAPPVTPKDIDNYEFKRSWQEVFDYAINHPTDDGHLQKCVRSLIYGEKILSSKYGKNGLQIKPDSWLRIANLLVDVVPYSAESSAERWLLRF